MSQRNITDLGKPARPYRADCGNNAKRCKLETLSDSRREDLLRAKRLRSSVGQYPELIDVTDALALAAKLEAGGNGGEVAQTLASSIHMRGQRINIAGAIWKMIEEAGQ